VPHANKPPTRPHALPSNVSVDAEAGRALFYVFVERDVDPAGAPIILWLNGSVMSRVGAWLCCVAKSRGLFAQPIRSSQPRLHRAQFKPN